MGFLNKLRDGDFTGLNRAFGAGKHSSTSTSIPPVDVDEESPEDKGIRGGPQKAATKKRFGRGGKRKGGVGGTEVVDDEDGGLVQRIARGSAVFFLFVNLLIYIAIAVFQKKWKVGPSSLTGLSIFVISQALLVSLLLLCVPLIYTRTNSLRSVARTLRITRVQFILFGTQTFLLLIMSAVATASAYTGGCKTPSLDPNAALAGYLDVLGGFSRNKRAAAAFWWFSFLAFAVSLGLTFRSWRSIRKLGPRYPTFQPPTSGGPHDADFDDEEEEDEEAGAGPGGYGREEEMSEAGAGPVYSAVRPSNAGGYYGDRPAFEDQSAPPGYGQHHTHSPRPAPPRQYSSSAASPTSLQYQGGQGQGQGGRGFADPFEEIRAAVYSDRNRQ